jgi:hypothetical protein
VDANGDKALTLDKALAEPIVRAMMAADGLLEEDVRAQLLAAATHLRAQDRFRPSYIDQPAGSPNRRA